MPEADQLDDPVHDKHGTMYRECGLLGLGEPDRLVALSLQLPLLPKDVYTLCRLIAGGVLHKWVAFLRLHGSKSSLRPDCCEESLAPSRCTLIHSS